MAAVLAACGGGGDGPGSATPGASAEADDGRQRTLALPPGTTIPVDANVKGLFGPLQTWPLIPLHVTLTADGRVLSYGTDLNNNQTGLFAYAVWDPVTNTHQTFINSTGTDLFCSSPILLASGDGITIAGGDNWTGTSTTNTGNNNSNLFNPATNTLTRGPNMALPRWYATSTMMLNGEIFVQGGLGGVAYPEIRAANATYRAMTGVNTSAYDYFYPRNFIAPDGRIFGYDSAGSMYWITTAGTGTFTGLGQFTSAVAGNDASAAMFAPGRILQFGGNSNGAIVIDINSGTPVISNTAAMAMQRRLGTGTLLPNGRVLATGGSSVWNEMTNVVYDAEIWNPATGLWTRAATMQRARLYHSVALLLPDATVLVAAGGAPGPQVNNNAEIYYPPYLFTASRQEAARPTITAGPTVVDPGRTVQVTYAHNRPVSRVTLVKTGSMTHNWNMDQRFNDLPFTTNGNTLNVQIPARASDVPPGMWMMFVIDDAGVPSLARIMRVNVAGALNTAVMPVVTAPGNQSTAAGTAVNLLIQATDPNGDVLSYSASGLPPGLAMGAATGRITGTPTTAGTYSVTAAASDGVNTANTTFTWTVTGTGPTLTLSQPSAPAPSVSGASATFNASATGTGVQYSWNFGDGTAATAFSASGTASHTYAAAGIYFVTVTATDASAAQVSTTLMHQVFLAPTTAAPSISASMAYEMRTGGASARLWVVNPDNDSVSVFDTVTRARVAEITVGAAPRTLAIAPNGSVWVTNKGSASVSVISATTLAVTNTIALPRGSQPYGIAIASAGPSALVALEGTGQLAKVSTTSFAITGTLAVGANARHVTVAADGSTAYVTRFVTPPLTGEGTLTVNTASGGGQVVVVNSTTMAALRTIVLAHSNVPDAENQGRGIPNYLGAAAISPDGTQAWVPSKMDNVARGTARDGTALNFQNTVRAISSRIALGTQVEDLASRIDHDNASLASAAAFDPLGVYLFVALETSREIAVLDAHRRTAILRIDTGMAPQGVLVSPDRTTLYVHNFMDRTVGVYDLRPMTQQALASAPALATLQTVATERLTPTVLLGKRLFYDARDTRLARDRYMSCASCHNDGGHDGRVWDLSSMGEGLRNTVNLRGRAGMGHGPLHWSGNFNEVQDFEGQIRALAGGTGLMTDAAYLAGTRSQPLGDPKAGLSTDLDALAAYVGSLATFDLSPQRAASGALSTAAAAGRAVFVTQNCASCHGGTAFSLSGSLGLQNIGTIKAGSGQRLFGALTGIDIPTLRDAWRTAPYLHDGSAATVDAAIRAHTGVALGATDLANLAQYVREIGSEEASAPTNATPGALTGTASGAVTVLNLTTLGTADWAHWGDPGVTGPVRKAGGGSLIGDYVMAAGGQVLAYDDDVRGMSWTDGAPLAASTNNLNGLYTDGLGNGYVLTLPASPASRTVTIAVGGWASGGTLSATLSDGSAPAYMDVTAIATDQYVRTYTLTYNSTAATATVSVRWTMSSGAGNVTLNAVALGTAAAVANSPPVVTTPAARTSAVGTAVAQAITASDPNGDALTYSATGLPAGLTIAAATGVISGTPTAAGTYSITVTVNDGRGGTASTTPFAWAVTAAANMPPVITTPAARTSTVGTAVTQAITASDANGDALTYSATGLPAGLAISATTGVISGTPTTAATYTVTVTVNDGRGGTASTTPFTWAVTAAANTPPVITTPAARTSAVGTAVTQAITASDPNGDALTYSAIGLPAGLTIAAATGVISGTPTATGTYSITVTVNDGRGGTANATFAWTVTAAANSPPVITTPAARTSAVGTAVTQAITASDPNGDALTYSATGLPAGLTIAAATGVISGTPTTAGTYSITVTANDGRGGTANATFTWTVTAAAAGSLTAAVASTTTTVNLATVGTLDWTHWGTGVPGLVRKAGVTAQISPYTMVGTGPAVSYDDDPRTMSWTGGTPTATGTANRFGLYVDGVGNGYTVTVPASTTSRIVTLYVGGWASTGQMRATLSDGSAAAYTNTNAAVAGQYVRAYTFTYRAGSAGQTLTMTWTQTAGVGNVTLIGAALR